MAFISICYLFCKNSSKLLPNKIYYLRILKIIGIVSLLFYLLVFILQLTDTLTDSDKVSATCKTPIYIVFNIINVPVSLMFLVTGFMIEKKIQSYVPTTEYEYFIH